MLINVVERVQSFSNSVVFLIYLVTSLGISAFISPAQTFHAFTITPAQALIIFCMDYCNCFLPDLLDSDVRSLYFTTHSKPQDNNHSENASFTLSLLSIKHLVVPTGLLCWSSILLRFSFTVFSLYLDKHYMLEMQHHSG